MFIKECPFDDKKTKHRFYKDVIVDVSIVYPASESAINNNHTDRIRGAASQNTFNYKKNKYEKLSQHRHKTIPVIIETFGHIHSTSESFIRHLINLAAEASRSSKSKLHNYWFKRISASLHRSNARMVIEYAANVHEKAKQAAYSSYDDTFKRCFNNPTM